MTAIRKARPSGHLPAEFIQLIQTDPAARHQLIGLLAETFAQRTDLQAVLDRIDAQGQRIEALIEQIKAQGERFEALQQESRHQFAEHARRMDALDARMETLREDFNRQFAEHTQRMDRLAAAIEQLAQRMDRFDQRQEQFEERQDAFEKALKRLEWSVNALGARWGMMAEEAFRAGLESILSAETGRIVERYWKMDTAGMVFGRPDQVEMDVVIHNGAHILIEIKSSVSRDEARLFARKVEFYEKEEGVTAKRRIIITPMLDPRAKPLVEELGLEAYTSAFDVTL